MQTTFEEHRYLSLLATMSKWMMRVLVERMRQHPRPDVPRRFHTIGVTQGWQTSAVPDTIRKAFWHARRFRRKLVMVRMDIRQCFDHMDVRRRCDNAGTTFTKMLGAWCCKGALSSQGQSTHRRRGLGTGI